VGGDKHSGDDDKQTDHVGKDRTVTLLRAATTSDTCQP
jgi:hypothetical protein